MLGLAGEGTRGARPAGAAAAAAAARGLSAAPLRLQ